MNARTTLLLWPGFVLATIGAAAEPFEWREASPAEVGMSAEKIEAAQKSLEAHGTSALLIIRHDRIACEWYGG